MCQLEIGCPICEVVGETVSVALQAFRVLDYELSIVMKTAAAVLLGRRREALICAPPLLLMNTEFIISTQFIGDPKILLEIV